MSQQLIKQAFEDFFYKARVNLPLEQAIDSNEYREFEEKIADAIKKQVEYFAKVDKINQIVGVKKAVRELTEEDLLTQIIFLWIPLAMAVNEEEVNAYLKNMATSGGNGALAKLKQEENFFLQDQSYLKTISSRIKPMMEQIDKTTQNWIARTIEQGLRQGASSVQIAKLLRDSAEKYALERASLIVEQETASIMAQTEYEVFRRSGITDHQWITARDEQVCPICMGNESIGVIKIGSLFPGGTMFPPAHIRCRCFIKPTLPAQQGTIWTG